MRAPGVVFLMYHELESEGRSLCQTDPGYVRYVVRGSDFRTQMQLLSSDGWSGSSVGEAIASFPERAVAITFDDGSETDLLVAAPILSEFGFTATSYITSGWLGRPGFLVPSQLCELSSLGFEIGSHSMTHAYLTDLEEVDMRREISDSKLQLEQILGKPVEHFSCPGGRFDARVARVAREAGYRTVSTSEPRINTPATNRFALGRVAVLRHNSPSELLGVCMGRGLSRSRIGARLREATRSALGNSTYDRLRNTLLRRPKDDGQR